MKMNRLNDFEQKVILEKATEPPFSGEYYDFYEDGLYVCKQCETPLFKSYSKFNSNTGWPSFDDALNVEKVLDSDGIREEIVCKKCKGHLGHVFFGEQFTPKNARYCVNSVSIKFIPKKTFNKAYFAAGCFWGVEYFFEEIDGVICAVSGYMGGYIENPTYDIVCSKQSGHLETVEVSYDENIISFEELAKIFFQIHDFTQTNGQGLDIGEQYLSAIFYNNEQEKNISLNLINQLSKKGYKVATKLIDATKHKFYKAEEYHQNYYFKNGKKPYCHFFKKIF